MSYKDAVSKLGPDQMLGLYVLLTERNSQGPRGEGTLGNNSFQGGEAEGGDKMTMIVR